MKALSSDIITLKLSLGCFWAVGAISQYQLISLVFQKNSIQASLKIAHNNKKKIRVFFMEPSQINLECSDVKLH